MLDENVSYPVNAHCEQAREAFSNLRDPKYSPVVTSAVYPATEACLEGGSLEDGDCHITTSASRKGRGKHLVYRIKYKLLTTGSIRLTRIARCSPRGAHLTPALHTQRGATCVSGLGVVVAGAHVNAAA